MSELLTPAQQEIMGRVREHARDLAAAVNEADSADISSAILLPELITILRESGFPIPTGLPFGLLRLGG